ncbi:MAG: PAS domain-containing sensor histidine kinase [Caulobacter sp.]
MALFGRLSLSGFAPPDFRRGLRRLSRSRYLLGGGYALAASLTVTGVLLASSPPTSGPVDPAINLILVVLGLNLILILGLAAFVGWRVLHLIGMRANDAGARLHLRFVALFSAAAVAPAVIVALFFGVLVNRGVEDWFSRRVQTVVENSATVARSYVEEQKTYISDHVMLMAASLNNAAPAITHSPVAFSHFLASEAQDNGFAAAYVLDSDGRILARAEGEGAPPFLAPPRTSFAGADEGVISAQQFYSADLFRALYRLRAFPDGYLYVVRPVDRGILNHLRETMESLASYREAASSRARLQAAFALSYIETAFLLLVGAVWLGIAAANSIAGPVARLVQAAGRVSAGDLSARVAVERGPEEIQALSNAFNQMTADLKDQQEALIAAGYEAEERRQFMEAVLSGVSAGVLGLDGKGRISAMNRQAAVLLSIDAGAAGSSLAEASPELTPLAQEAMSSGVDVEAEVDVTRGADTRRLRVRASGGDGGLVLTFDDITRLVAAQRNAAWKDVARRIAHEIKNPLTPIQLSAERLRRKYRKDVTQDVETFDRCTETIIRQVGDIGRMVDEFSAFARMPAPKFAPADPMDLLRETVFAQRVANPDIDIEIIDTAPVGMLICDARMVGQALTNILKNAAEAIAARRAEDSDLKGRIVAEMSADASSFCFIIEDNGVGLPTKDRDRLTEPYVTTREKGTGLGLAIVKRVLEDHGGDLVLTDAGHGRGARAILRFPVSAQNLATPPSGEADLKESA